MPVVPDVNPYLTPAQPPMLPQAHAVGMDANGVTQDERTMGMLMHLLGLLTGFIGILILWLVKKDQSRFIDFHGREALNFMISMFLYTMSLLALALVVGVVTMGIGIMLIIPIIMLLSIGQIVCEVMACIAANRGDWHRYPMTIRMIPDAK
ncbi:hypothetical protein NT6N_29590 [Oceaniferula spumae]|uniref:DUF4870 domain-containing protein n=1 Tax=Oceaniferula spumae TaxID=2979115 RepID=A0AAT9FPS1_9BACT